MSQRLFLSAVSDQYAPLRVILGEHLRSGGYTVVQQAEFVEVGVNTLVKLAEFIEHESDIVLHLIGSSVGNVPPADVTNVLLKHCGEDWLRQRFPKLFEADAFRRVTYTQWEAWLGLFYGKRVLLFQADDALAAGEPAAGSAPPIKAPPMAVAEHLALLKPECGYPTKFADEAELVREALKSLSRIITRGTHHPDRPCHLPYATLGELFIGRDGFLADLRQRFEEARAAGRWPKQAVCGVGGIGKTRVVVEYALKHRDAYTAVLMVNGDSPESLRRELAAVAGLFVSNLDPTTPEEARERATLDWLQRNPGWLLIVDNADTETARDEVARRLGQWANGHLLITARFARWPRSVESLELHVLSAEDATRFLLMATDRYRRITPDDNDHARDLAGEDLDGLCLALQQAAAYIAKREISFAEYRRRWAENVKEARTWADKVVMEYHTESEVSLSVATTWLTTFRELTPAARTLLEMLAWLAPDPIPRGLFDQPDLPTVLRIVSGVKEADIEEALAELRQYSLVSHSKDESPDSAGRVHRVIQLITRQRLTDDQRQSTLFAILVAVNNYTPTESYDICTWPILDSLRPHLTALIVHADAAGIVDPTTRLLGVMGELYRGKALFAEAEPLMRRALAIAEQSYGAEHPNVAIQLNNLAGLLQATNRLAEAEPLMRRALAINEQSFGANHPTFALQLNNLAQLLQSTNRLTEAELLLTRVVNIFENCFEENDPSLAKARNNLALLLAETNRLTEAEPLMRRGLVIAEKSYGAEHPQVALCLNNLAQLLKATNRLLEAEPLMRRALTIDEMSYGAEHPKVAIRLNNLAQLLHVTNRLKEAEPLMRRALTIDEQSYGAEHPDVARDLNNLARLFQDTNRLAEAEPLMRRALAMDEQSFGSEHPNVALHLNNLARLLQALNRLAEAEPLMRRNVAIFVDFARRTGHEHPHLQEAFANFAELLKAMGRSDAEVAAALLAVWEE